MKRSTIRRRLPLLAAVVLALAAGGAYVIHNSASGDRGRVAGTNGSLDDKALPETHARHETRPLPEGEAKKTQPAKATPEDEPAKPERWPEPPIIGGAYPNPGKGLDADAGRNLASLEWLKDHQNEDGHWSAADFGLNSGREGAAATHVLDREGFGDAGADAGAWDSDLAATSLALLSYLGAGYDHHDGRYRKVLRLGLIWLRKQMRDGAFVNARGIRDQALATMAVAESYGMSGDQPLKKIVDEATAWLIKQRAGTGGWGEFPGGEADVISTAYAVSALKSVGIVGCKVDKEAYARLGEFLDSVATAPGATRYSAARLDPPGSEKQGLKRPPVCAAAWMVTALLANHRGFDDKKINARADLLLRDENLPKWERGRIDFEYWWFATQAIFQTGGSYQTGGKRWDRWQKPMGEVLQAHERGYAETDKQQGWDSAKKLDEHGSWDAQDVWSTGGRVGATTLATLCLQTYYRYARVEESNKGKLSDRG